MGVVILIGLTIWALALMASWMRSHEDKKLLRAFDATSKEARASLPLSQMQGATETMQETLAIERAMVAAGVNPRTARHMTLRAGIATLNQHMILNRLVPDLPEEAAPVETASSSPNPDSSSKGEQDFEKRLANLGRGLDTLEQKRRHA